jgi:hypothetical protein
MSDYVNELVENVMIVVADEYFTDAEPINKVRDSLTELARLAEKGIQAEAFEEEVQRMLDELREILEKALTIHKGEENENT